MKPLQTRLNRIKMDYLAAFLSASIWPLEMSSSSSMIADGSSSARGMESSSSRSFSSTKWLSLFSSLAASIPPIGTDSVWIMNHSNFPSTNFFVFTISKLFLFCVFKNNISVNRGCFIVLLASFVPPIGLLSIFYLTRPPFTDDKYCYWLKRHGGHERKNYYFHRLLFTQKGLVSLKKLVFWAATRFDFRRRLCFGYNW